MSGGGVCPLEVPMLVGPCNHTPTMHYESKNQLLPHLILFNFKPSNQECYYSTLEKIRKWVCQKREFAANRLPRKFQDVKFKDPKFKHEIMRNRHETFVTISSMPTLYVRNKMAEASPLPQKFFLGHSRVFLLDFLFQDLGILSRISLRIGP